MLFVHTVVLIYTNKKHSEANVERIIKSEFFLRKDIRYADKKKNQFIANPFTGISTNLMKAHDLFIYACVYHLYIYKISQGTEIELNIENIYLSYTRHDLNQL